MKSSALTCIRIFPSSTCDTPRIGNQSCAHRFFMAYTARTGLASTA